MLASCKLQLCRTQHHLAHNVIGIGTRDTVLDRCIAQGLDCHGDKCRSATTHRAAHKQQARIEFDHRTELAKQIKHHCALLITKRGSLLASDDALAHRNRRVGHRRDMRDARQDLLPLGTVPGPGNRQNDLFGKSILEWGEYLLDHVRFDRSDHDIGCGDNLGGIVAGDHANNDMAGDEEGSWKTAFEDAGYEVTCLVNGLGQLEAIQQLFVEHAQAAVDSLTK